ncbi:hypothetical protein ACWGJB_31125 [Streptomyces sp. NPDC054813]
MPDLPYPYHRLQAEGPDETGFAMLVHIEDGAGGPLKGQTSEGVLENLRTALQGDDSPVITSLTRYDIATTDYP